MSVRGLAASAIFVVMLIAALALWTAIPLGWIWVGSKVADTQFPAEGPYAVVAVGIVVSIVADAWLIGRLNALYVQVTGTNRLAPMRPSWLKSMRDTGASAGTTTVVEAVMVASAMLAGLVLLVWFFFLAGSPLPDQ
jgi:DNA-binding transcriptional regulator YbjK